MQLFTFFFFLLSLYLLPPSIPKSPAIGVAFNPKTSDGDLPSFDRLVSALRHVGIRRLLLNDPDPSHLSFLKDTDISIVVSLQNLASYGNYTDYLLSYILPFDPRPNISAIILGRDGDPDDVIPDIAALRSTISALCLPPILSSTILSFSKALDPAFPPFAVRFQPHLCPLLKTLDSVGSPIFFNIYLFDLWRRRHFILIGLALFEGGSDLYYNVDSQSEIENRNPFDFIVDSTFTALSTAGHREMPVAAVGTGWPSGSAGGEGAATVGVREEVQSGSLKAFRY